MIAGGISSASPRRLEGTVIPLEGASVSVELRGCYPILATPFRPDGEIDEESVVSLVNHLRTAGLPGFTMFGLASEFYKLSDSDRET
jgi:hypothetical protein